MKKMFCNFVHISTKLDYNFKTRKFKNVSSKEENFEMNQKKKDIS